MKAGLGVGLLALLTAVAATGAHAAPGPDADLGAGLDVSSRDLNPPRYPSEEARAGISGTTVLIIDVDAAGAVRAASVEKSSGNQNLDQAAIDAARTWRFNPGRRQGRPVAGRVRVPVEFDMGPPPTLDMSLPLPAWDATHPIITGAAECDEQLQRMLTCAKGRIPEPAFELMLRNADAMQRSLATLTVEQRQEIGRHCATNAGAAAAHQHALGCAP
ncbi:MAG: energy transducer TonB [Pseudoxanthomonas sp.]